MIVYYEFKNSRNSRRHVITLAGDRRTAILYVNTDILYKICLHVIDELFRDDILCTTTTFHGSNNNTELIVGMIVAAILCLIGVGWSIYRKKMQARI